MSHFWLLASACAVLALAACNKTPTEREAEAVSEAGRVRAEGVRERASDEASALDDRAKRLSAKAKTAGGYTGDRLDTQADAAAEEADIVRKQGRLQAESVEEAANAQAKAVRSR